MLLLYPTHLNELLPLPRSELFKESSVNAPLPGAERLVASLAEEGLAMQDAWKPPRTGSIPSIEVVPYRGETRESEQQPRLGYDTTQGSSAVMRQPPCAGGSSPSREATPYQWATRESEQQPRAGYDRLAMQDSSPNMRHSSRAAPCSYNGAVPYRGAILDPEQQPRTGSSSRSLVVYGAAARDVSPEQQPRAGSSYKALVSYRGAAQEPLTMQHSPACYGGGALVSYGGTTREDSSPEQHPHPRTGYSSGALVLYGEATQDPHSEQQPRADYSCGALVLYYEATQDLLQDGPPSISSRVIRSRGAGCGILGGRGFVHATLLLAVDAPTEDAPPPAATSAELTVVFFVNNKRVDADGRLAAGCACLEALARAKGWRAAGMELQRSEEQGQVRWCHFWSWYW